MGLGDTLRLKALATAARIDGSLSERAYDRMMDGTVSGIDYIVAGKVSDSLQKAVDAVMEDQQPGDTAAETIKDTVSVSWDGISGIFKATPEAPKKTSALRAPEATGGFTLRHS